ncbi:MAG TPA: phosphoesterase [Coprothermobacter sp.]|nr:phosphoesterase [Coprothermobacter sp.]
MRLYYDLHIHSALSPCASDDMTPNNIVNMCLLKGLDIIAVTDHNSVRNVEAVVNLAQRKGLIVVPGMEVQTKEEVHVLCYFYTLDHCYDFQAKWEDCLPRIKNRPEYFGNQLMLDEDDELIGEYPYLLLTSSSFGVEDVFRLIRDRGVAVFAHVDRLSFSVLSNLGFIPDMDSVAALEISGAVSPEQFLMQHPALRKYRILQSSDAHYLGDIMERVSYVEVTSPSVEDFLKHLSGFA